MPAWRHHTGETTANLTVNRSPGQPTRARQPRPPRQNCRDTRGGRVDRRIASAQPHAAHRETRGAPNTPIGSPHNEHRRSRASWVETVVLIVMKSTCDVPPAASGCTFTVWGVITRRTVVELASGVQGA